MSALLPTRCDTRYRFQTRLLTRTASFVGKVDREFRVLDCLAKSGTGFPSPRPYVFSNDHSVTGTDFYVVSLTLSARIKKKRTSDNIWQMEYIGPGRIQTLDVTLPMAKDAQERREMWVEALTLMAKLHKIDYKKIGLQGFVGFPCTKAVEQGTYQMLGTTGQGHRILPA